jgi:hypothetical protein
MVHGCRLPHDRKSTGIRAVPVGVRSGTDRRLIMDNTDLDERLKTLQAIKDLEEEVSGEPIEDLKERYNMLQAIKDIEEDIRAEPIETLRYRLETLEAIKDLEEEVAAEPIERLQERLRTLQAINTTVHSPNKAEH